MKSEFQTKLIAGMQKRAGEGADAIHQRLREFERIKLDNLRLERTTREEEATRQQKALDDQERRQQQQVELKRKEEAYQKEQEALQEAEEGPRLPGSDPDTQKLQNAQSSALGRAAGPGTPSYVKGFTFQRPVPTVKTAAGRARRFINWLGRLGGEPNYRVLKADGTGAFLPKTKDLPKRPWMEDLTAKNLRERWLWTAGAPLITDSIVYGVDRGLGDNKPYVPFGIGQGEGPGRAINALVSAGLARIAHGQKFTSPAQSTKTLLSIPHKELIFQGIWGVPKFLNNQAEGNLATNRLADATQAIADKGTSVTVNQEGSPSGDSMPWWVLPATGAAILGTGALGILGARAMRPPPSKPDEGTIQVHLPAPEPGLADTVVSLPSSEFNISKTMKSRLARDVRRRLRKGTEARTQRRPRKEGEDDEDDGSETEESRVIDFDKAASGSPQRPRVTLPEATARSPQARTALLREEGKALDKTPFLSMANLANSYGQLAPWLQRAGVDVPILGTWAKRMTDNQSPVPGSPANAWVQRQWGPSIRRFQGTGDNLVHGPRDLT